MAKNLIKKTFTADTTWVAPAGVTFVQAYSRTKIQNVDAGQQLSVVLDANGNAYTFGRNLSGQLGTNNSNTNFVASSPVAVVGGLKFIQIAAGFDHVIGITSDGTCYGWGSNQNGQLGNGTNNNSFSSPVAVIGGLKFSQITAKAGISGGIATNGQAYMWGANGSGALGTGDTADRSSPVAVVGGIQFAQLSAGNATLAIDTNGNAYSWGLNDFGSLGDGTLTPKSSPVLVLGGIKFSKVQGGENRNSMGLDTSGNVWTWGYNNQGQLGANLSPGSVTGSSSPVAVVGGLKAVFIGSGEDNDVLISTSGAAYTWGGNPSGSLGDGTSAARSSPVLVLGGLSFVAVRGGADHMVAVTSGGKLYAWGNNATGELGDGTLTSKSSPVLVLGNLSFQTTGQVNQNIFDVIPGQSYSVSVSTSSFNGSQLNSQGSAELILVYEA